MDKLTQDSSLAIKSFVDYTVLFLEYHGNTKGRSDSMPEPFALLGS